MLVADIERGGVFGVGRSARSHLLTPDERALFRGFAINKFRGDRVAVRRRRADARRADRRRPASACFPTPPDMQLDAEDSLALQTRPRTPRAAGRAHRDRPVSAPVERHRLPAADLGRLDRVAAGRSTTTSSSCPAARTPSPICAGCATSGLADWILEQHRARRDGHRHLRRLSDARTQRFAIPTGMESTRGAAEGLGLLPA